MSDIKSAREIALEKVEKLGEITEEERRKWKYVPEGERLAGSYLNHDCNLATELAKYEESIRKYVIEGAADILVRNIHLPKNDAVKQANKQAMEGFKLLKNDKVGVEYVYSKIRRIFTHYAEQGEQQRRQAYQNFKLEFEDRLQQALQQQTGSAAKYKVDVEKQPQFHDEWRKILGQLDSQYLNLLNEYKQEMLGLK